MLNRKITDFGVSLALGYGLIVCGFFGISIFLFSRTEFAEYLYVFIVLGLMSKLNEPNRNDFLKTIFVAKKYLKIRRLENLLVAIPFVLFLVYELAFVMALVLIGFSVLLAHANFSTAFNFTVPTPFGKKPYEFTVGFRKTYFVFPIAYFLTFMSVFVGNFNLGVFSMLLVSVVCLSYYSKPENEYLVWAFSSSSNGFLIKKVVTGLLYFVVLVAPILISLSIFFFNELAILLIFFVLCCAYLVVVIFAKYAAYPREVSLPQVVLVAVTFVFPPMLVVVMLLFYSQAMKKLKPILE